MSSSLIPLNEVEIKYIKFRKLEEETCKLWSYGFATFKGQQCHVATYRDENGTPVAQKLRFPDKSFVILGDAKKMGLYGQHLWRDGGRKVVVTEGEIDALSMSQAQGNKWPVVSLPNGAAAAKKAIQSQLEWLEKFDEVILMFDNDEPGRKAVSECADLFTPGKCKLAVLPLKDASEMLQAGRTDELRNAVFNTKTSRPDGIVAGTDLWERLENRPEVPSLPFFHLGLNVKTKGSRVGEVILFTSGSGMGKTELVGQIEYDWLTNHNETVGIIHLEEPIERSSDRLMGFHLKKRYHFDEVRKAVPPDQRRAAYEATVGSGRVFLYEHFGSTGSDSLFNKIRYLVKGCGCTSIFLDHISIVVSGVETNDERKLIDVVMTRLATMAQELKCRVVVIAHLKRVDGKCFNEGDEISINDLRGSASLEQLSHTIIALERNQQDEEKKLWTHIRVLKCRHTGDTGSAGWVRYDPVDTGWFSEDAPVFGEDSPFKSESENPDL